MVLKREKVEEEETNLPALLRTAEFLSFLLFPNSFRDVLLPSWGWGSHHSQPGEIRSVEAGMMVLEDVVLQR